MTKLEVIKYLLDETLTHLRHLEEQRTQFCSVLIAVVAGILAFGAGGPQSMSLCGSAVLTLGVFGMLLSWRQNEKINYYKELSDAYLIKLLSDPSTACLDLVGYHKTIRDGNARRYLRINRLPTGLFWSLIYLAITLLGVRLLANGA